MDAITNLLKGAAIVSVVAVALCAIATSASADPKKKQTTSDVRIVPKYHVIHPPNIPRVAAPSRGSNVSDARPNGSSVPSASRRR